MTLWQQSLDCLLSFGRTAIADDSGVIGFHYLGESPQDAGYRVKITLSVRYSREAKSYSIDLATSEERFEGGFNAQRFGFGMPSKHLGDVAASRFSAKRVAAIYETALQELRTNPQPLIELLQEESERK